MAKWISVLFFIFCSSSFAKTVGTWTKSSFQNSAGVRNYYLYVPQNRHERENLPLMVMLHGCEQDATAFAAITGMDDIAERYGFAVVYPEQTNQDNVLKCWNWFKPENQKRDSGELSLIVGIVKKIESSMKIDTDHVFVAGLSAGAAMAANLIAVYPDLFAGAGIHSGLEYKAATSEAQAWQVQSSGPTADVRRLAEEAIRNSGGKAPLPAIIVIHGTADKLVNPVNSVDIVQEMTAINDLLDDGQANNSQTTDVIAKRSGQVPNGHSYTTEFLGGQGQVHIENVIVDQMDHAWSGARQSGQFADPKGPDASAMIWFFLWNYSLKRTTPSMR